LHVRLTAAPVPQMSCVHVSASLTGGPRDRSVTSWLSIQMVTAPSVSAEKV